MTANGDILAQRSVPSFHSLSRGGLLSAVQAARFIEFTIGDEAAYIAAKGCLTWWQRPFARWILTWPGALVRMDKVRVRKLRAPSRARIAQLLQTSEQWEAMNDEQY